MNKTELVQLLTNMGMPAHMGLTHARLQRMYNEMTVMGTIEFAPGETEEDLDNPMHEKRRELMDYLNQYREVLLPQLGCDGNCFAHPDAQVALCWLRMKRH